MFALQKVNKTLLFKIRKNFIPCLIILRLMHLILLIGVIIVKKLEILN